MQISLPSPLLLDAGLASLLEAKGHNLDHPLWSAYLLKDHPQSIYEAHLDHLRAGARIITTASYQASFPGFREIGIEINEASDLLLRSVQLADEARETFTEEHDTQIWIAASIGPYGAYLADGSEYRGNYGISREELKAFHRERIEVLLESEADFFACETLPSLEEAIVLAEILQEYQKAAWISFSCQDHEKTNEGQYLKDCVEALEGFEEIFAIGVNCSPPQYITALITEMKKAKTNKQIIVYPNSGEEYHPENKNWSGESNLKACRTWTSEWIEAGADIIGGCCRMLPTHLNEMKIALKD
ncbi:MAG: homocysteine S-methyltransferase [Bacteroidota bacterium]